MIEPTSSQDRTEAEELRIKVLHILLNGVRVLAETAVMVFFLSFCLGAPILAALFVASVMVAGSEFLARR